MAAEKLKPVGGNNEFRFGAQKNGIDCMSGSIGIDSDEILRVLNKKKKSERVLGVNVKLMLEPESAEVYLNYSRLAASVVIRHIGKTV
jgi:hypothetical protein